MDRFSQSALVASLRLHERETGREPVAAPADDSQPAGQRHEHIGRIVRTIEADIIPRLVKAHRPVAGSPDGDSSHLCRAPEPQDVERLVRLVMQSNDAQAEQGCIRLLGELDDRGVGIESIYLDLLAPAAKKLGRMWEEDECMFTDVTIGLGRLHSIVRSLSDSFTSDTQIQPDGRRVLLVPAPGEQHTFGLAMVAEFFRRAGWDVVGGFCDDEFDAVSVVKNEWFDLIGVAVAVDSRLSGLRSWIAAVRQSSRNRAIGVMVGGPTFTHHPERTQEVGADASAEDARLAPQVAEQLLSTRSQRV